MSGANVRTDYEMLAARLLHTFPGYTLETLLREPPSVFFRLAGLMMRIENGDTALDIEEKVTLTEEQKKKGETLSRGISDGSIEVKWKGFGLKDMRELYER